MRSILDMPANQTPDAALARRIADLIVQGQLPLMFSRHIAVGDGTGWNCCAACGRPIEVEQTEYAVNTDKGSSLHFHMRCHTLWQIECDGCQTQGTS